MTAVPSPSIDDRLVRIAASFSRWSSASGRRRGDDETRDRVVGRLAVHLYHDAYAKLARRETSALETHTPESMVDSGQPVPSWSKRGSIDWGWRAADTVDPASVLLARSGRVAHADAGRYLTRPLDDGSPEFGLVTDTIDLLQDSWIYIRAGLGGIARGSGEIRIYLNADAGVSANVVPEIVERARLWGIALTAKFPKSNTAFRRPDSVVLYVGRRDLPLFLQIVETSAALLEPHLRNSTPMFTRRLWRGVGLAESPPDGKSFGMTRMEECAEILTGANAAVLSEEARRSVLAEGLAGIDLSGDQTFRVPGTRFPYDRLVPGIDWS